MSWMDYFDFSDDGDYSLVDEYSGYDFLDSGSTFDTFDTSPVNSDGYNVLGAIPDSSNSWFDNAVDKTTAFLGSEKGLGLLTGLGAAGVGYLTQESANDNALEALNEKHLNDLEYLRMQDELERGKAGSAENIAVHNAGISALAAKYPSDPNFKRR